MRVLTICRRGTDNGRTWSRPVEITAAFEALCLECDWQATARFDLPWLVNEQ
ncbi:MAG: hypothetical protein ACYSWO_06420 [Planctomycetota bacterium]